MKRALLADIGGTHARFAVLSGGELGPIRSLDVEAHGGMCDAVQHFLTMAGGASVEDAVLAVAGPVDGRRCVLTNSSWIVDAKELQSRFGFRTVRLLNDHEAAVWGLSRLAPSDSVLIGPDSPKPGAPMALLGPGTGLGMACYLPGPGRERVVVSEGGHGPWRRPRTARRR
jgi:glucokinase